MGRFQDVLTQLELAKWLIREEIQESGSGKNNQVLKVLDLVTANLVSCEALPHSL